MTYENKRYGWKGVRLVARKKGYTRSLSGGLIYAAKRIKLVENTKTKPQRKHDRKCSDIIVPGEKVQIDVKEVPYFCLSCSLLKNNVRAYQWTAIDESTRMRFLCVFEEHDQENSVKFFCEKWFTSLDCTDISTKDTEIHFVFICFN